MSEVKVNKISPRSGTTVTLGDSGDTISIPSGVTFDASSGGLAGTLTTAAQPNITSVGTLTSFTSTGIDDNATSTAITIDSLERVGIGTSSPNGNLHVAGGEIFFKNDAGNCIVSIGASDSGNSIINLGDPSDGDVGRILYEHANNNLQFKVNASERMRINSAGNVGIGTSSPGTRLSFGNYIPSNGQTIHTYQSGNTVSGLGIVSSVHRMFTNSGSSISFGHVSTSDGSTYSEAMRIDSSGKVSIGDTTSSGYRLKIKGTIANNADDQGILLEEAGTGGAFIKYDGAANLLKLGGYNAGEVDSINIERNTGNVGIGTTSPVAPLTVASGSADGAISLGGDVSSTGITNNTRKLGRLVTPSYATAEEPVALILSDFNGSDNLIAIGGGSSALNTATKIAFLTASNTTTINGSERMRIDSAGHVLIDTTSAFSPGARLTVNATTGSVHPIDVRVGLVSDGFSGIIFRNPNGAQGSIAINSTSVSYNTSSDYRLKENVVDLTNATERLKQLQPKRFNFIANADTTVDGFLAHEVSSVVPEAISGTHNEVEVWKEGEELPEGVSVGDNKLDGEGNTIPVYQGIDQAKLVPLLVKTIQELEARITALETQP